MPPRSGLIAAAAAAAAAVVALVVAPGAASAAVTCELSSGVLDVTMSASEDTAALSISSTDEILVDADSGEIDCAGGTPTTTTTNAISVHNAPGLINNTVLIARPQQFAPGLAPEPGDDEIEIALNLNDTPGSVLQLVTATAVVAGSGGVNPNAGPGEDQPDTDILNAGTARGLVVDGSPGADLISMQGGRGTGAPVSGSVLLIGRDGADVIEGGNGGDDLFGRDGDDVVAGFGGTDLVDGGAGTDVLTGGDGADSLWPGSGADLLDGGPGQDTLDYSDAVGAVSADLEGTGVEHLIGSRFADVLLGDNGPNTISGLEGDDRIDGRGGADSIFGSVGADTLQVRDGGTDTADCGPGADDTVTADQPGLDLLFGCETVIFPRSAQGGGSGAASRGGGSAVRPTFGARTRVTIALADRRMPASGPLRIRVSNANGFAVRGTLSGQATRRLGQARRKRGARLAAASFTVPANARTIVRLTLPRALRRQIARTRTLSLRMTVKVRDPAGSTRTVRKTLRPRRQSVRQASPLGRG